MNYRVDVMPTQCYNKDTKVVALPAKRLAPWLITYQEVTASFGTGRLLLCIYDLNKQIANPDDYKEKL